jgi:chromate reductase
MPEPVRILGLCGSLRAGSYNAAALRAVVELDTPGVEMRTAPIGALPLFNADVEAAGLPAPVVALREQLGWAQAVLFVSPEYNHSIPGVLKNAIDWGSRGPGDLFSGKAAAVTGASTGAMGSSRMQAHLRNCAVSLDLQLVNRPEVMIGRAQDKFDAEGRLTDEPTRVYLGKLVVALRDLALRLRG